jgi:peptidoglycan-N-acetylglucosamine deacetylase
MWPDGKRFGVAFTFDFDAEEVWIGENPANSGKPGVLSQGTYGARVAVPLILELLRRHGVTATFFVPGRVAERHPERVRTIVEAGHELAHHGYTHTSPTRLSPDEEHDELVKARSILESFGVAVRGYRSPSWDFSPHTLELLASEGFAYSSNLMSDIRPFRHEGSPIVELPVHWILDDAAHFWFDIDTWTKKISTVPEVRTIWEAELEGIRRLGGLFNLTMHPQIIGRPGRLPLLEEMIRLVDSLDDAWVTTLGEIASRVE